jgi:hypothetical protein
MGRLRDAWQALRGYAAPQDSRASAWAPSGGSANAEVGQAAATVARRARDAVRNDPYAARIADLWTANAVGAGITTRWPDPAHGTAWTRWTDSTACDAEARLDLYGLQALVMRAVVESGECFIRMLPAEVSPANPIGLRLQVLESDHLDTGRNGVIEGLPTLQGIALGDAGAPAAYWLHRIHPGASWLLPSGGRLSSEAVPARDVLHIYRKRRPGQLRDVSWLAPVLLRLRDLGDYEAALLMKAKIEACLAAVVSEEGDEAVTLATGSAAVFATGAARANKAAAGTALDLTNLAAGRAAVMRQKTLDGIPIAVGASMRLVVGPNQELPARQLTVSVQATQTSNANVYAGFIQPLVEPLIPANRWYLFSDPQASPVYVYGYLNGAEGPQVTTGPVSGVDGVEVSVIFDFGVGAIDWRGGWFNAGT